MNYLKQMNAFYKLLPNNPLSSNAQCLYFYLLNKNNELNWIKEFTVANMIVCGYTNLSRQALDRARNELKQKGYIDYQKGFSNQAGKYLIVSFDTQNDTQDNTQNDTQDDIQDDTQSGHRVSTLYKQNKTKLKKEINKEKVFIAPTLEEIKKYVLEKNLNVDAENFYNYFTTGNWIDSKGNKVKNWKQKIITWNSYKPKAQETKPQEKFVEVDTSNLTDEEYSKLIKGKITMQELIEKGRVNV